MNITTVEGPDYIHKGIGLSLTQEAYITGSLDNLYYEAHAIDNDGVGYLVRFSIKEGYNPEEQEECDACDWKHPLAILRF